MPVIPFYGADRPDLFAIERAAMDRPGRVVAALDHGLPAQGCVLDVGAGDGFTGMALQTQRRRVVAVEPSPGMVRPDRPLAWVGGEAERLPFGDGVFDGAYATWAYFFTRDWDPTPGVAELHRVVRRGAPLLIVDNLGDDEFTALSDRDITADVTVWHSHGFACTAVDTHFEFESLEDARTLLSLYFGTRGRDEAQLRLTYRVALFSAESRGAGRN